MDQKLRDALEAKLEELGGSLEELEDNMSTLDSELTEAYSQADSAEDCARYAWQNVKEAQGSLNTLEGQLGTAMGELTELRGLLLDASSATGSGLSADIARYRPRVTSLMEKGHSLAYIVDELEISEFLATTIWDLVNREKAA